jgi:hypothetical protein
MAPPKVTSILQVTTITEVYPSFFVKGINPFLTLVRIK